MKGETHKSCNGFSCEVKHLHNNEADDSQWVVVVVVVVLLFVCLLFFKKTNFLEVYLKFIHFLYSCTTITIIQLELRVILK